MIKFIMIFISYYLFVFYANNQILLAQTNELVYENIIEIRVHINDELISNQDLKLLINTRDSTSIPEFINNKYYFDSRLKFDSTKNDIEILVANISIPYNFTTLKFSKLTLHINISTSWFIFYNKAYIELDSFYDNNEGVRIVFSKFY